MRLAVVSVLVVLLGCGARSGLRSDEDAGSGFDAGTRPVRTDAGRDGGFDAGTFVPPDPTCATMAAVISVEREGFFTMLTNAAAELDGNAGAGCPHQLEVHLMTRGRYDPSTFPLPTPSATARVAFGDREIPATGEYPAEYVVDLGDEHVRGEGTLRIRELEVPDARCLAGRCAGGWRIAGDVRGSGDGWRLEGPFDTHFCEVNDWCEF